jgi:hypothetical protein
MYDPDSFGLKTIRQESLTVVYKIDKSPQMRYIIQTFKALG